MKDLGFLFVALAVVACGGHTIPDGTDAGNDAAQPPIGQCHGYCPQPNGASCTSDCDCTNKCIGGVCSDPVAPSLSCDDAGACPAGQKCGPFGGCEGAACSKTADCPIEQECISGACVTMGCI
jgi:hypothetical protein